jgi:hypothetical protein
MGESVIGESVKSIIEDAGYNDLAVSIIIYLTISLYKKYRYFI